MLRPRSVAIPMLALMMLVGCGEDGDGADSSTTTSTRAGGGETELTVSGLATRAGGDPMAPVEVPFSGSLDCGGDAAGAPGGSRASRTAGTGVFMSSAPQVCQQLASVPDVFDLVGDPDRMCSEIYGGSQTARIEGTVAGKPVDVEVARNDGCGIDDWTTLEFLLGPPER